MPIAHLLPGNQTLLTERELAPQFADALLAEPPALPGGPSIEMQSVATGLATLYERLRNTLDFRDEHLIRVYAIRRMLKRRLVRGVHTDRVALPLLQELVRSGYVNASAIPESTVAVYQVMLEKYIQLFSFVAHYSNGPVEGKLWNWIFTLAANEIEEHLAPDPSRDRIVERLAGVLQQEHMLERWNLKPDERERQVRIAIYRSFLKLNNELISWHLFRAAHPWWTQRPTVEQVQHAAATLPIVRQQAEASLRAGAGDRLGRTIKPATTTLWLLHEMLRQQADREFTLRHPDQLRTALTEVINAHQKAVQQRLRRTLRRSLFYIFLTKMAIALLIEIPTDRLLAGAVNVFNLVLNIAVPLSLLLIFGLSVALPGDRNTKEILAIAERLVYEGKLSLQPPRPPATYHVVLATTFNLFYGIFYLITFGVLITILLRMQFTIVGILLFLLFLSIVSFFGFRIRAQARELVIVKSRERFLVFVPVLFFLPILQIGRWISQQSSRINVFLYFFDLFIEAPLQAFLEFFDKFTGFVREKREDITT